MLKQALFSALLIAPLLAFAETPKSIPAITPSARPQATWTALHESFNKESATSKTSLVFLGDSITRGWDKTGKEVWAQYWAPYQAANFGIGGDRTEHVLWRLDNGNMKGMTPKLVVLMIGTNNTGHQKPNEYSSPASETAQGVQAIIQRIHKISPETKVLLLGIFPRGADASDKFRQQNEATNAIIKDFADNKKVFFMDIGAKFLEADGTLSPEIMPDRLHLSAKGYTIWAEAIKAKVEELLK